MDKHEVSRILEEIGTMLELKGEHPFKARAYFTAARTISGLTEDLTELVASGRIREFPGIGKAIADKLAELLGTGRLAYYEELKRSIPPGLLEMTEIPGLGPRRSWTVWEKLGISTIGELEYACLENRLANLPGFGKKTQEKIQEGILQLKRRRGLILYAQVIGEACRLLATVKEARGVRRAELVGELRRRLEVIGGIGILAEADRPDVVLSALQGAEGVAELAVTGRQVTAVSYLGVPVTVTVLERMTPHAVLVETGSAEHVAQLEARAARLGIPLRLRGETPDELWPKVDSEEALYRALDLPFIEPELREGMGEIEAAEAGQLTHLIESEQIQGIFHTHTTYSDGAASLAEMVAAAKACGYRYIGISDHSQSAAYANGLKEDRVREQHAAIDALRQRMTDIAVFKGIEADILPDGSLDYPDEVLARFDFVIGSVHSRFNLSEEEQTQRVIRALANPYLTMLGHPTGRLLLSREGYRIDMHRVIDAAKQYGKVIEVNANPHRLDLDWRLCRYAKQQGVKVSINPDAHATDGLQDVPFGVNVARKGGLQSSDVVNTLGPDDILPALRQSSRRS